MLVLEEEYSGQDGGRCRVLGRKATELRTATDRMYHTKIDQRKVEWGGIEIAQQIKMVAAEPDDLSLSPGPTW